MKTIYAIPGLATTSQLFQFIKVTDYEIKVLEWPLPKAGTTMEEYAMLFVEQIDQRKPFMLMGVSFGGMLCSVLSHLVNAERVILISSCKNRSELPPLITLEKYIPVYKLLSERMLRFIACNSRWFLGFDKKYQREFEEMIHSMPENYMKVCIDMVIHWKETRTPKKCVHIHGTNDRILNFRYVKADHVIVNGTHSMIVNNANEINELLDTLI